MVENTSSNSPGDMDTFLVIGANGSVGSALVNRLIARGARVILAGRNLCELALLADAMDLEFVTLDATVSSEVQSCIDDIKKLYGRIAGVANCVGSIILKPAHLTNDAEWHSVIETNLTSAFLTVKYAAKAMMGNGGSIALVSSAAAHIGLPNHEAIAAAKAGVEGLVRSAAATYARHNIRVNCVAPGLTRSKLTSSITDNPSRLQASTDMHALGRIGEPADVAHVLDWLLSSQSSWVTGQSIVVDGGLSSVKSAISSRREVGATL